MKGRGFLRRHRATVASGTALAVAAGALVVYAVTAEGYRSHETELNDGGIWVTTSGKGYFGRVNKPIAQMDGAFYYEPDTVLDVLQDGAAVVGVDHRAQKVLGLDPAQVALSEGGAASVPNTLQVDMRGGTLASVAPDSGKLWASRYDARTGQPLVEALDRQSEPLTTVGRQAVAAVGDDGRVVAASAEADTVTVLEADDFEFSDPREQDLPEAAGEIDGVTAVGTVPVTLDSESGRVTVLDGPGVELPGASTLQVPGPEAGTVLVASRDALHEVDLASGEVATVVDGVSGRPTTPVRLGACVYGAWSGSTGYVAVRCGSDPPRVSTFERQASDLVFRVNRGEILLNDQQTGAVWDIDSETPLQVDNWEAFTQTRKVKKKEKDDQEQRQGDRRRPQAKPDQFGARPGRTSVLYPLDNDTAPEGRLLAIRSVDAPAMPGAQVAISPDRQTLQLTLPAEAQGTLSFGYQIDDGRNLSARSTVNVAVRGDGANTAPAPRPGYEPRRWRVPSGGSVEVPVLPEWRDYQESDPLLLASVRLTSEGAEGATARATNHGRVRFTAPREGGDYDMEYAVTDGIAPPVSRSVRVTVQDRKDVDSFPPSAEPDVVSGEVGQPIMVRPLANDLPGSDPSTPDAELSLSGMIAPQAGLRISTDSARGTVRIEADKPGTFLLDYTAAYGNAPVSEGQIRVDVRPRPPQAQDPVAMPDTLTVHGQSAATVDVLANDVDPAGGILVVQGARAERPDQLDVSVVEGRWLRIAPRQATMTPQTQVVRYTVSNGAMSGVSGEVVVSQRPVPEDTTPVAAPDRAVVRAGEVVVHPVLDNDFSPTGDRLELVADHLADAPGQLTVNPPDDYQGDTGSAFVSRRSVRFIAPRQVEQHEVFTVPYLVANATGQTAQGRLTVEVVPVEAPNSPPTPPVLEGRMVAGDVLTLELPGSGVDPDGDPVAITGISSVPTLGRIQEFGATSLVLQAFPGSVGTEEFSYTVVDTHGAEATGTVRVAVVPPAPPQPPVAVPDQLTVAPGATARVDILANDQIGAADAVRVSLVDAPDGVSLESPQGPLLVRASGGDATQRDVVYTITNGLDSSSAVATVVTVEGYNNPPVVQDAFGRADDSDSVTVDLLSGDEDRRPAFDPDGSADDLRVTDVYADPEIFTLRGSEVTVRRTANPQVVPFRVEDGGGGVTTASLFVPSTGNGRPYLRPDAMLELQQGSRVQVDLGDYLVDPSGRDLELSGRNRVWASPPDRMDARGSGAATVEVSARPGFRGPAALVVEVQPAREAEGGDDAAPRSTLVSIPVQVGTDQPELNCPEEPFELSQAGSIEIDIASVCFVWTLDPADRFTLDYSAELTSPVAGVSVDAPSDSRVRVSATGAARAGSEAEVTVRAGDSEPQTLRVRVTRAPAPSLLPIQVADMRPGSSREIDLAQYLRAGVSDPQPTILDVTRISGSSVQASASGSVLRLTAPGGSEGRSQFRIEMSDVSGDPGPERRVTGQLSLEVLDVPSVPGSPVIIATHDKAVDLNWRPSTPRGAPIDHYEVREVNSGERRKFRGNGGRFRVPANDRYYAFVVRAHNRNGYSDWSQRSVSSIPVTKPGRVQRIFMRSRGDKTITIGWSKPRSRNAEILAYHISYEGKTETIRGDLRTFTARVDDNNKSYTFTIRAENEADLSEPQTSAAFYPLGTPPPPPNVEARDLQAGVAATTVEVGWTGVRPEGPGPTVYTVSARSGNQSFTVAGCSRILETRCRHTGVPYDGRSWRYFVTATNSPTGESGNTSAESNPASFAAVGVPDPWGSWKVEPTGRDRQVSLDFTVPESRGAQSRVSVLIEGEAVLTRDMRAGPRSINVTMPSNEQPYGVTLRLCNELGEPSGCKDSNRQQGQSYGPLNGKLDGLSGRAAGPKLIEWSVSGTTNGRPARLQVTSPQGTRTIDIAGTAGFSQTFTTTTAEFEQRQWVTVRLVDPSVSRGSAERTSDAVSGPAPPPNVVVSRLACQDDLDPATEPCGPRTQPWSPACTSAECGKVVITTTDMNKPFRCVITNSAFPGNGHNVNLQGNQAHVTNRVFDRGTVTARCWETSGSRPAGSGSAGWPSPPSD